MILGGIKEKLKTDKHFAELLRGASTAFILRMLGILLGYLFALLVTRNLGAKAWGIFALSLVILQIASVFGRLGLDTALLRFTAEYVAKGSFDVLGMIYKKALILVILSSIFVSLVVYSMSSFLAEEVFHDKNLIKCFHFVSFLILPYVLLLVHSESIRGLKKIKTYMFLQQVGVFLFAIVLFLLGLLLRETSILPVIVYGISIFILSVVSIIIWFKSLPKASTFNVSYKFLLSVAIPMLFSSSLALVIAWTDTIILGIFRNPEEVGVYNVAVRLSLIVSLPLAIVNTIIAPKFAEFFGLGELGKLQRLIDEYMKWISIVSFFLFFLICFLAQDLLAFFFKFQIEGESIVVYILSFGQLINVLSGSTGYFLSMTGKQREFLYFLSVSMILNIVLNFSLIPKYGAIGAALASSGSMILWNLLSVVFIWRVHKVRVCLPIWRSR